MDFIIGMLRTLFFSLDKIIYGLIDDVYSLLMQIARTSIFDQDAIHAFSRRIYVMLGIFMLFKLMISIANYILNPDDLVDKDKGFTNIVKKAILSLVMIVLVPYIFNEAYALQSIILKENTIMNIIFGSPSERAERAGAGGGSANSTYVNNAGKKIQFTILYTFFQPNFDEYASTSGSNLLSCRDTYKKDPDNNNDYVFRKRITFDGDDESKKNQTSGYIYELNPQCFGIYNSADDKYEEGPNKEGQLLQVFEIAGGDTGNSIYQNYAQGVAQQNYELMFKKDIVELKNNNGTYVIDYKWGVSTAIGIAVVYLFLLFSIDIAARSIKLGFLELIAPVPIISYCDPKSSKDGMFKKWFDMCWKTYLELFFRLFALYFGIYVISLVGTFKDVVTGEYVDNWLVSIFMILGILIFIKKLPDILKDGLGINTSGKFQLNPLKKIEDEALGGKLISGAGKKATGLATGVLAGTAAATKGLVTGQGIHRANFTSAIKGAWKGDKFGKNYASSYGAGRERHKQLQEMAADGVGRTDVAVEKFKNIFRGQTPSERIKNVSESYKAIQDAYSNYAASLAGTDAIGKEMENRRKAAHEAGDYTQETRWQKAFDARLKEVAQNGGNISFGIKNGVDLNAIVDDNGQIKSGSGYSTFNAMMDPGQVQVNNALNNYANHMDSLIKHLNNTASDIAGFTKIDETLVSSGELKKAMGKAKGVQGDIDSNADNRKIHDVAKHAGTTGKKS